MMKKELLCFLLMFMFLVNNVLGMENPQKVKTVKMFHCTRKEIAKLILKEGLKSRFQLAREGKATVPNYWPTADHYDSIFFQYIDEDKLKQIEPSLWMNLVVNNYCIGIEVDPNKTNVYNPDLRITPPFKDMQGDGFGYSPGSHFYIEDVYKQSGMPLKEYIEKRRRFINRKSHNCSGGYSAIPDPLTAEPLCVKIDEIYDYTGYYFNEHTIKKDRIDPSEFAQ